MNGFPRRAEAKALNLSCLLFIKRDDLLPGCAGGNKTRKLDFFIADALAQGADTIITCDDRDRKSVV